MNSQNTGKVEPSESNRQRVYRIGGIAALLTVAVAFSEGAISFLPGGNVSLYEVCASFIPVLSGTAMIFAVGGLVLNVTWMLLLGLRFFQLVRENAELGGSGSDRENS